MTPLPPPFRAACLALALALPVPAGADGLANGLVRFSAELAPACLDGAYPCTIGTHDGGLLSVTADPQGRLRGGLDLRGLQTPVAGKLSATRKEQKLVLNGGTGKERFKLQARLKGDRFVGAATSRGKAVELVVDGSDLGKLLVEYDLMLSVDAAGRVTGSGTATACGVTVPVTASGRNGRKGSTLRVSGGKTAWMGTGPPTADGFTATWKARGFGAKAKGTDLDIGSP